MGKGDASPSLTKEMRRQRSPPRAREERKPFKVRPVLPSGKPERRATGDTALGSCLGCYTFSPIKFPGKGQSSLVYGANLPTGVPSDISSSGDVSFPH